MKLFFEEKKENICFVLCNIVGYIILAIILYFCKMRFSLNSAGAWFSIIIIFLIPAVSSTIASSINYIEGLVIEKIFYVLAIISTVILIIGAIASSPVFSANERYLYSADKITVIKDNEKVSAFPDLLGKKNDTSNIPLIGLPEAIKKSETEMGKIPALGSQFELLETEVTSQNINGELCYVVPLEPKSFIKWSHDGNKGYFIISRNTGETKFVEDSLTTTAIAPFGDNAKRIINNYLKSIGQRGFVTDISPEVDDEGTFHYISTIYTINGIAGMRKVIGIVDLDAKTKTCKYYSVDEIPSFVDRVYPESFFEDYISYYGNYKNGFWNSLFGQKEVLTQTEGMDVVYVDDVCYYYTGFTSSGKGESSNGFMMMNSVTGEIEYHITYGISESKAQGVAMGRIQEKEYVASYPLILKVAGMETYFMIMRDKTDNLCGYAFVNYKDYTKVAVGENLLSTQAAYIKSCSTNNSSTSLNNTSLLKISGTISDISSEVLNGTTIYYVKTNKSEQIFSFYSELAPTIVFAKEGDSIEVSYVNADSVVIAAVEVKLN